VAVKLANATHPELATIRPMDSLLPVRTIACPSPDRQKTSVLAPRLCRKIIHWPGVGGC